MHSSLLPLLWFLQVISTSTLILLDKFQGKKKKKLLYGIYPSWSPPRHKFLCKNYDQDPKVCIPFMALRRIQVYSEVGCGQVGGFKSIKSAKYIEIDIPKIGVTMKTLCETPFEWEGKKKTIEWKFKMYWAIGSIIIYQKIWPLDFLLKICLHKYLSQMCYMTNPIQ